MEPIWSGYNTSRYCTNYTVPYGTVMHEETESESDNWIDKKLNQNDGEGEVNKEQNKKTYFHEKESYSSGQNKYPESDIEKSDHESVNSKSEEETKSNREVDSETSETESYHKISDPASSDSSDHSPDRAVDMVIGNLLYTEEVLSVTHNNFGVLKYRFFKHLVFFKSFPFMFIC